MVVVKYSSRYGQLSNKFQGILLVCNIHFSRRISGFFIDFNNQKLLYNETGIGIFLER